MGEKVVVIGGVKTTTSNADIAGGYTTNPPTVAGNLPKGWMPASSIADAEFLSLPRPRERCRFSNLSRTHLIELLDRGDIAGVTIRRPGATRGRRLVIKKSLADFLYGLADEQAAARSAGKEVSSHE